MNAKKLYDFVKNPHGNIETLISNGILNDVMTSLPSLIVDILEKNPYDIYLLDSRDIETHPEFAAAAIKNGFGEIGYFSYKILRKGCVKAAILDQVFKENCKIDPADVPKNVITTFRDVISDRIANGNKYLVRNLPKYSYELFLDSFVEVINSKNYDVYGPIIECFPDEFLMNHEDFFLKIINGQTVRFFSKDVLMHYADKFPISLLESSYFYKYNKGSFAKYFESHEEEVTELLTSCSFNWSYMEKMDKKGLTKDMIRKIYGCFKKYNESYKGDFYCGSDSHYYFFISEIFGANYLKGLDDIVNDICLHSLKALKDYGTNIKDPDVILEIIRRDPSNILYLNDYYLENIELTAEDLSRGI